MYDEDSDLVGSGRRRRRGERVEAELWVQITGLDSAPVRRCGNLAATGVYLAIGEPIGSPGDLVKLTLQSIDKERTLRTLARVVRVLRQDDRAFGARVIGMGLEFLPLQRLQPDAEALLLHVLSLELSALAQLRVEPVPTATVTVDEEEPPVHASLSGLGIEQLTLATAQPIAPGSQLRIYVPHHEGMTSLTGKALANGREAATRGRRATTLVQLTGSVRSREQAVLGLAQTLLIPEAVEPPERAYYDFTGELGAIRFAEVLDLLRKERYSGVLSLGDGERFYSIELRSGEISNIEAVGAPLEPTEKLLRQLADLEHGEFKFRNRRTAPADRASLPAQLLHDVLDAE